LGRAVGRTLDERESMRKTGVAAVVVLFALAVVPAVQATKVPTVPTISGAVFTTVDLHDSNYPNECKNGNPAVNCNQYTAKKYVFLNGGPTKNQLSPDGVYFYAVLAPSGQANPNDGTAENLSDDYDCYRNREFTLSGGEVSSILSAGDTACFPGGSPFAHQWDSPFVGLFPYADTPNPGGVYIMAVCYVGPAGTTTLAAPVTPSLCKYDAFKVVVDTTAPTCKLISKSGDTISVAVQDAGSGLEDVDWTAINATVNFPAPLLVGSTGAFYINATKKISGQGATLTVTVSDPAGNKTVCDPVYGQAARTISTTLSSGTQTRIQGVRAPLERLTLHSVTRRSGRVTVAINGHPFAMLRMSASGTASLNLAAGLLPHHPNTITVSTGGARGKILVRISK
jgi:hypothetical protein